MKRLLVALFLAAQLLAGAFAAVPARVEITYAVFMGSMKIGEGRDVFQHDGRTYRVVSESKTAGVAALLYRLNIRRESQGRVTRAGLRPRAFSEERNGKAKRSAAFDWERKQATLVDGDSSQTVPLPHNSWDSTSFGYNFAFVPPEASELAAHLTDGRRLREYRYAVLGREKLDTELGALETLHVKRLQGPEDKRAFDVWLAVDQHNMPVRIRYTEKDGTVFDSVATKITFADK
jgi:hypothetical protein